MSTTLNTAAELWTDAQLLEWSNGELVPGEITNERAIADEVFKRCGVPFGTINAAKALIQSVAQAPLENVAEPVVTPEPEVIVEPTPVVEPVVETPVVKPEPTPTPKAPAPATGSNKEKSPTQVLIEESINEYLEKMAPGRSHTGNAGELLQLKFYRTLSTILRLEGSEFARVFSWLLLTVNAHREGVFHERYVFRYFDAINLTNPERRNFERLVNMLITTCNPKTRNRTIKQVDIPATMAGFKNSAMHQRVMEFYTGM